MTVYDSGNIYPDRCLDNTQLIENYCYYAKEATTSPIDCTYNFPGSHCSDGRCIGCSGTLPTYQCSKYPPNLCILPPVSECCNWNSKTNTCDKKSCYDMGLGYCGWCGCGLLITTTTTTRTTTTTIPRIPPIPQKTITIIRGGGGGSGRGRAIPLGIMSDSTFLVIAGIIVVIILVAIFGAFQFFAKKK